MPKKKKSKKNTKNQVKAPDRPLLLKEDNQEYAQIIKLLGDRRMEVFCYDGETRIAQVRGKLRKWCRIDVEDIVLVSIRDFQDRKADIIHKYFSDEVRKLQKLLEIPDEIETNRQDHSTFIFESENPNTIESSSSEEEINFDAI